MSKYQIHIDKPLPDSASIGKFKDFEALHSQYQVSTRFSFWQNLYRKPRYVAAAIAALAVMYLIVDSSRNFSDDLQAFVQPPFPEKNIPLQQTEINPAEAITIELSSGEKLNIPAHAFVTSEGEPINEPVTLVYRKINDPLDVFFAGIPLNDDSTGNVAAFGTERLWDIRAYHKGKSVQLAEGVAMNMEYTTADENKNAYVFHLDTTSRNWQSAGKEVVETVSNIDTSWLKEAPVSPEIAMSNVFTPRNIAAPQEPGKPFGVKIRNGNDFPQFRGYERIFWEYIEAQGSVNPWEANLVGAENTWRDVRVRRLPGRDIYQLIFSRSNSNGDLISRKVIAKPIFEANSQQEADRIYRAKVTEYQQALIEWEEKRIATIKANEAKEAAMKKYREELALWNAQQALADSIEAVPPTYSHTLTLQALGIHGVGASNPTGKLIKIELVDDAGISLDERENIKGLRVYGLDTESRTFVAIKAIEKGKYSLSVQPETETIILARLNEKELGWAKVSAATSNQPLVLTIIEVDKMTREELNELILK